MIFRRIKSHIEKENWFAVFVDFFIVVVGVFIGLQVANWNEARADRVAERVILERLASEFEYQKTELEFLTERLELFRESAKQVTMAIKSETPPENREQFAKWLFETTNLGRPPARSATYVQLLSSGDFDLLSNAALRDLLVKYDQNIERNGFLFNQTLALLLTTDDYYAATNSNFAEIDNMPDASTEIIDYDFESLKSSEGKVEWLYYMHSNNLAATNAQLTLANEIIKELEAAP